jgi:aminoglycoside 3-N-acetyltransferase
VVPVTPGPALLPCPGTVTVGGDGLGADALADGLRALGLPSGHPVLVHCSMRRIGPVDGGAATLLAAIRAVIGPDGTVIVPSQTGGNSLTSDAYRAATRGLSARAVAAYRERMPGFDPATTPSQGMGALAECVRRHPAARRSAHPQTSFAALGPDAARLTAGHRLDSHLGEASPLPKLYDADAWILLVGVGYDVCTAFHLAEHRLPGPVPHRRYDCFVRDGSGRRRLAFEAPDLDDDDFGALGAAFDAVHRPGTGMVGGAIVKAVPFRRAVDFAIGWMVEHRTPNKSGASA